MATELFGNAYQTTLTAAITGGGVTSCTVALAPPTPLLQTGQWRILIDSEIMLVTAVGGAGNLTLTIARGQESTTAAAHSNGATVTHILTAGVAGALWRTNGVEIDLCRPPYNAVAGTDITTVLQTAINALTSGGTIFFSQAGTYLINGAQQTGTAFTVNYSGQILFPAVALGGTTCAITIRGPTPLNTLGADSQPFPSVVLKTNATSGWVFSVIPAFSGGLGGYSNVCPIFQDIAITTTASDPQCGGLDMVSAYKFACERVNIQAGGSPATGFTGTLAALRLPGASNAGFCTVKDTVVAGWPIGYIVGDHACFAAYVSAGLCGTAIRGGGGTIGGNLQNFHVRGCATFADAPLVANTAVLEGNVHIEPGGLTIAQQLINDPNGAISGRIVVDEAGYSNPGVLTSVFSTPQSQRLDIALLRTPAVATLTPPGVGWMGCHPVDLFLRSETEPSSAAIPGRCSQTNTPWYVLAGAFANTQGASNGTIVSTTSSGFAQAFVRAFRGGVSRSITVPITTQSGAYNFDLYGHYVLNGTHNGNTITVQLTGGNLKLFIAGTLAQTASGVIAASTSYTLALALTYDQSGLPNRARVYLNGTKTADAYVTAAEQALLTPVSGASKATVVDGFGFQSDTASSITGFTVSDPQAFTDYNTVSATAAPTFPGSGGAVTIDSTQGSWQTLTVTDGTGFTINAPTNAPVAGQTEELTVEVLNSSGGSMGTITWNAAFIFAGLTWTNPASTKKRYAAFRWNGAKWICRAIASADY